MEKNDRIYVAGHSGLVGSAIVRKLRKEGYSNLILKSHSEVDLRNQEETGRLFRREKPDYVFLAAAYVGGINANRQQQARFIYDNLMIALNTIHTAYLNGVKKLLNLGSSCIYPKFAPQPMQENSLLTGPLEPTNEGYSIAKISAIKLCRYYNEQYGTDFLSVMPTNLYGPNDNFDPETSHALPGIIGKVHRAKVNGTEATLWGNSIREFLHADDLAEAVVFLMNGFSSRDVGEFINIGTGKGISIKDLAAMISEITGYQGTIKWDNSMPEGTPEKVLDVSRINKLGWNAKIGLREGIEQTYSWYCENEARLKTLKT